jgi:ABC transport system ATP-binding/permease protein
MLTGEVAPDAGTVEQGTGIEMAVFDQTRAALDPEMSLWESLTGDPVMRVSGRADQVMVRGQPRHVVGYLKDFLFSEAQARAPVKVAVGGREGAASARAAHGAAVEPSGARRADQRPRRRDAGSARGDRGGLRRHGASGEPRPRLHRPRGDRDRRDGRRRAGDGLCGGWSDYRAQRGAGAVDGRMDKPRASEAKPKTREKERVGLSFTERHRLEALPGVIARLEAEIGKLGELLSDPALFAREPVKFRKASEALSSGRRRWRRRRRSGFSLPRGRKGRAGALPPLGRSRTGSRAGLRRPG